MSIIQDAVERPGLSDSGEQFRSGSAANANAPLRIRGSRRRSPSKEQKRHGGNQEFSMRQLFLTIDKLLRGELTSREDLRQGRVTVSVRTLLVIGLLLGAIYGVFMGLYAVLSSGASATELAPPEGPPVRPLGGLEQMAATTIKVPLLFLLTLVVTFPSLYVFSTLAGSRLRFVDALRLLLAGIAINLALLASFGPITGFFTLSTESYDFMKVLNVVFFTVGGIAGLVFMYKALGTVLETPFELLPAEGEGSAQPSPTPTGGTSAPETPRGTKGGTPGAGRARLIFYTWTVIYSVVGAQMGWILRPFVGDPELPFELFRKRESNFFEAFFQAIARLL